MSRRWVSLLHAVLLCVAAWLPSSMVCAQTSKQLEPQRFRRVFAPTGQVRDWPLGDEKYMRVDPAEFERLLRAGNADPTHPARLPVARITSATYEARLEGDQLIEGTAELEVEHTADGPVLMSLVPCRLALGRATWGKGESASDAIVGLGVDQRLNVLVERSGTLHFDWSLSGARDVSNQLGFDLRLPACPRNRLVLELPEAVAPAAEGGLILKSEPNTKKKNAKTKQRRWHIELGGRNRCALRITTAPDAGVPEELPGLHESVVYDLSLRGVEIAAEFELQRWDDPLRQIQLVMDDNVQVMAASCGEESLSWSVMQHPEKHTQNVAIALPETVCKTGTTLRVKAFAPLTTKRQWQLPRIRPQKVFWQEGRVTVLVPAPLTVTKYIAAGCRQSGTGPLTAPRVGESTEFQMFSPDARIELVCARRKDPFQVTSTTFVELRGGEMTAQVAAGFQVAESPRFRLEAGFPQPWLIDTVQSQPADVVDDWTIETDARNRRRLVVHLAKALSPSRPIRLRVGLRRLESPLDRELSVGDLVPLQFGDARPTVADDNGRHLIAVAAEEPYRLRLLGTQRFQPLLPESLSAEESELFGTLPEGLVFVDNGQAADLRVTLEQQKPSYSASIEVEAVVSADTLREQYVLACVPDTARVDRLIVHFGYARETPIKWNLVGDENRELNSRRLTSEEQIALGIDPEEETWELTLRRPQSEPFEIYASREIPLAEDTPISLAMMPEASQQRGTLVVRCLGPRSVQVANRRLRAIPVAAVPANRYQTAVGAYRYDPLRDASKRSQPTVSLTRGSLTSGVGSESPSAWVWNSHLRSRYEVGGRGEHLLTYRVQCTTTASLHLSLPLGVTKDDVRNIWIEGERVMPLWLSGQGADGEATYSALIDLPAGVKFPMVVVHFATPPERLGIAGTLRPPLPEIDVPVLAQFWTVWLPPGYETFDPDGRWQAVRASQPSLTQRLFGPLGRSSSTSVFDPLHPSTWSPTITDEIARHRSVAKVRQLLKTLGELTHTGIGGELTWGDLLDHPAVHNLPINLLVDSYGLEHAGVEPQHGIRPPGGDDLTKRGIALLQEANLALLVRGNIVLLTDQTSAALYHAYLDNPGLAAVWWVARGPLAEQLQHAATEEGSAGLVPAGQWRHGPLAVQVLWQTTDFSGYQPADIQGWSAFRLGLPKGDVAVRLKYVHRQSLQLFGITFFLATIGLGWWTLGDRPLVYVGAAGLFAVAGLLIPSAYAVIASGGLLGALFCLLFCLLGRCRASHPSNQTLAAEQDSSSRLAAATSSSSQSSGSRSASSLLFVLAMLLPSTNGVEAARADTTSNEYRVFVPVDENQKPTGEKYFVPVEFFTDLYRREASLTEKPQGWLIGSANYRATLAREAMTEQLGIDEFQATFDVHVLSQVTSVAVPLGRQGVNLLPDGALLDGRPIQPEWDAQGNALIVEVPRPGKYRLELALRPTMRASDATAGFDVVIPRLATARLEVITPVDAPPITVSSAVGLQRTSGDATRWLCDLGPTDKLSVHWPEGTVLGNVGVGLEVDQLTWMKVQPGSVVIDAKLRFSSASVPVKQVELLTDPHLRLLPLEGERAPQTQVRTLAGKPQTITLTWPHPLTEPTEVQATFLLTGTSGVGRLRLPRLDVAGARIKRRWLAVSVDPALEAQQSTGHTMEAVAVPDFAKAWKAKDEPPAFAYQWDAQASRWSLATRPRETQTAANEVLWVGIDQEQTSVLYQADLVTTAGYTFEHRLKTPADLLVERVSVRQDDVERVARFFQEKDGQLTVFFTGPVSGQHQLEMQGRVRTGLDGEMTLPQVKLEGAVIGTSTLRLYHQPSVHVELSSSTKLAAVDDALAREIDAQWGRPVGWFPLGANANAQIVVSVSRNRPRIDAEQLVWLQEDAGAWTLHLEAQMRVRRGWIDQLRVELSPELTGPFQLEAEVPTSLEIIELPGVPRHLILRPEQAASEQYAFHLTSPLMQTGGERPKVPPIRILDVERLKRRLALPSQIGKQLITWETRGLREAALPDGSFDFPGDSTYTTYVAGGGPIQAALRPLDHAHQAARVRLADVRIAWQADGSCRGVATFDVQPGQSSECRLHLPIGYRLVQVRVADVPTAPVAAQPDRWRIALGPQHLPQRIDVVFQGHLEEGLGVGAQSFIAPRLEGLPVMRTLWTIAGPPGFEPLPGEDPKPATRWRHEMDRVESASGLIEAASLVNADDPELTLRWYRRWAGRLATARRSLEQRLSEIRSTRTRREIRSQLRSIDQQQAEIAQQLGMTNVLAQLLSQTPVADDPEELWQESIGRGQSVVRLSTSGGSGSLAVRYRQLDRSDLAGRLLLATALAGLVALIIVTVRRQRLGGLLYRWPHVVGVGAGLFWWLWLWPSVVGIVIVAVCVAAALLPGWKRTAADEGSSLVSWGTVGTRFNSGSTELPR